MFLSIIIPCRNEEQYIKHCLESVLNNDYPREEYEIIVVDGESSDKTVMIINELQKEYPNIKLISNPKRTAPTAMNIGIQEAKGEIVMRMDAHTSFPDNYISTLLHWKEELKADNIGAICKTEVLNENKKSIAIRKVLTHRFGVGNGLFRTGIEEPTEVDTVPFGCYHKNVFEQIGGYDERLIRNQDIELNKRLKRAGGKIILIPHTHCVYYARETFKEVAQNNYNNGLWNILTVYYTKTHKSLSIRHFVPLVFVLSLTVPLVCSYYISYLYFISVLSLCLYLIALNTIIAGMNKRGTSTFLLLSAFLTLHISYGFGSFVGLFHIDKLLGK